MADLTPEDLKILIAPDPRLHLIASEVTEINENITKYLDKMYEKMVENNGIGLAATQVNLNKRLVVIEIPKDTSNLPKLPGTTFEGGPFFIINPKIIWSSDDSIQCIEGCLSLPNQQYIVKRPSQILVRYQGKDSKEISLKASGLLARCIQHEIDHLDGILYIDKISNAIKSMAKLKAQKIKNKLEKQ